MDATVQGSNRHERETPMVRGILEKFLGHILASLFVMGVGGITTQIVFNTRTTAKVDQLVGAVRALTRAQDREAQTRYTAGEAARDFGAMRNDMTELKYRLQDHEQRVRALEGHK